MTHVETIFPRSGLLALLATALIAAPLAAADKLPPEHVELFEKSVRPLLAKSCYSCHSHAAKKSRGGLMLDSRASMLAGGDSGPALVPGQPDESLIVKAVRHADDVSAMPPTGKLTAEEIATLAQWVRLGAPWPGAGGAATKAARPRGVITAEDRQWWSFQPVASPAVPSLRDAAADREVSNPIDRFILSRLSAEGLAPAPEADRATLIRRLYADVLGVPPSPEEVARFVADPDTAAYDKLVDRLLADPRYGQRWARHWLDLVRYAESDGYRIDDYRPTAWRYRDYVIDSLNADKPYDRFVREQLAGDEIAPDSPEARIATGFLRLGIYEYNNRDVRTQWDAMLNDITDTLGDVFLGLGMGCARCHDHKFDPILQRDYYRLQAFIAAVQPYDDRPVVTADQLAEHQRRRATWEAKAAGVLAEIEKLEGPMRAKAEQEAVNKFPDDIQAILRKPTDQRTTLEQQLGALAYRQVTYEFGRLDRRFKEADKVRLIELRRELAKLDADRPAELPLAMTVTDVSAEPPPTTIPKRPNDPILPGVLTLLNPEPATVRALPERASTGRRSALADWLTRADNPLTTRVLVNRVWHYHFGRGLVATTSDFGRLGERPSHPELLDWLATEFVRGGWRLKPLHRLILTSRTYRQSARHPAPAVGTRKDPENRLLWRGSTRRLDAEQIRDAVLTVTGQLDGRAGGPGVDPSVPRRSVYLKVLRNSRDALLDVFDVPEGIASVSERNTTTTPTQALLMINSPAMLEQARRFAARLRSDAKGDESAMLEAAFRLAYGRAPTATEAERVRAFLDRQSQLLAPPAAPDGEPPDKTAPATAKAGVPDLQYGRMPFREGRAMLVLPDGTTPRLMVPEMTHFPAGDFTVEAFVQLRSVYDTAAVRPILSWGQPNESGMGFGVTSRKSAFKPEMLVLQMWGVDADGKPAYEPVFSSLHIDLNKPYFVAVSVKLAAAGKPDTVSFFAKDLSNDDEPMLSSVTAHKKVVAWGKSAPVLGLGSGNDKANPRSWDGLIDDVRVSAGALAEAQLLFTADAVTDRTVGFWQFEANPGMLRDVGPHGLHLIAATPKLGKATAQPVGKNAPKTQPKTGAEPKAAPVTAATPRQQAWIDFCHVLLNSNEFLYVD